ncbi:glycosyl transferase [Salinimicrobium marinum]|uniref:Glycosyl transferase n=1 Tax=Salinimicrobium marinum TaxID=680283 RepID=A0A918W273_9FLAO|nr:glycosyltransferase family 2 protein [Salinimicrobium marinum]GHA49683.1 glycosyl transferase [Salinimicrobium marinum]
MKISIITIVYNRKHCIADCIQSVLDQTYHNIEHIIIDGGSTDGTQEVIEKYRDKIAFYISEKDEGVFDAYNKGIKNATGDVIGVLNSDDFFFEPETIQKIAEAFSFSGADLVYANGLFVDQEDLSRVKRIYPSKPFRRRYLSYGWIPLHTTIFVRKEVFEKNGFYHRGYTIASDYEISLRWFKNDDIKKFFLNEWVVKMRLGGLSTSARLQLRKSREDLRIIKLYHLNGLFTLACKIGRKIPQYLVPQTKEFIRFPSIRLPLSSKPQLEKK